MTINARTFTLNITPSADGKRYSQYPNGDGVSGTVTGSGFGVAPNVVLYRTMDGTEGNVVSTAAPDGEVGAFTSCTLVHAADGAAGFASSSQKSATFVASGNFRRYRFAQSIKVPDGYFPPGDGPGTVPSDETWGSDSSWKPAWLMLGNTGSDSGDGIPDLCVPTMIGSGAMALTGNTTQPGVRYWDYEANTDKPSHHWKWDEWNTFQLIADCDGTNPATTAVSQVGYFTSANTSGASKTTGTKTYSWNFAGMDGASSGANAYFDRVKFNPYAVSHPTQPEKTMTHYRDLYLAVESSDGANDYKQACFLGNASTLANCTRIKMKVASAWSDTSVTIPIIAGELAIYTHAFVQNASGTVTSAAL